MDELTNKVAVVTGAASGIGLSMSRRFLAAGMKVVMADVEEGALKASASGLGSEGSVLTVKTDVSSADQMDRLAAMTLEHFGGVHVVCNNAGVPGGGGEMWTLGSKDWEWVLGVNLWGVIHGIRVFGQHLVDQNEGHFVNTASVAGLTSFPTIGPYNVSKHGVVTLSETLRSELKAAKSAVGVSVLCPSAVNTKIHKGARNRPQDLTDEEPVLSKEQQVRIDERQVISEAMIEQGVSPDSVADLVHDAILVNQFYIFTNTDAHPFIKRRLDRLAWAIEQ